MQEWMQELNSLYWGGEMCGGGGGGGGGGPSPMHLAQPTLQNSLY